MAKKTISVERTLELANRFLRITDDKEGRAAERLGVASLLTTILHECDAYAGFGYLSADQVPSGCRPGMERNADGTVAGFPDESRRVYYQAAGLRMKRLAPRLA